MTFFIGLTGGIATGKSTASQVFKELGCPIIDCDKIAHQQQEVGQVTWKKIKNYFGNEFLNEDQTVNRKKLGKYVFSHPDELKKLSEMSQGTVFDEIQIEMKRYSEEKVPVVIVDVPLLFENNDKNIYDATVLIAAPYGVELDRLMKRNNLTKREAEERIASQMPLDDKRLLASYVVENTGTIDELRIKLKNILDQVMRKEGQ